MPVFLIALALQAAPGVAPAPAAPAAQSWSILTEPCAGTGGGGSDVVVCGRPEAIAPRLPLPQYRGPPDHAVPSNPDMKASVALDGPSARAECGAYGENCPVGLGGAALPALVNGVVDAAKSLKGRRYKNKGVPIDLDQPALDLREKVHP